MTMDTNELIARAESSLEGVTPGPWSIGDFRQSLVYAVGHLCGWPVIHADAAVGPSENEHKANARFIAASRQLAPDLITALRVEKEARERAEAALGLILAQLDNSGLESGSGGPVGERAALRDLEDGNG